MIDILFKIYFEAFYWEISLFSLGFSWSPFVGPEGVLCEVLSNRWIWSQEVKGQLFIDLNTRYSFNLMLFLVLDGENLAFSQLFWVLKISAKTTISLKISSKLTAKSFLIVHCMLFLLREWLIVLQSCYPSIFFQGKLIGYS